MTNLLSVPGFLLNISVFFTVVRTQYIRVTAVSQYDFLLCCRVGLYFVAIYVVMYNCRERLTSLKALLVRMWLHLALAVE